MLQHVNLITANWTQYPVDILHSSAENFVMGLRKQNQYADLGDVNPGVFVLQLSPSNVRPTVLTST